MVEWTGTQPGKRELSIMARKRNEARSFSTESGGAAAPLRRPRTTRSKPASAAEPAEGGAYAPASDQAEIARLAYSYWEARGGQGGSAEEDWLRAEQEYRHRGLSEDR